MNGINHLFSSVVYFIPNLIYDTTRGLMIKFFFWGSAMPSREVLQERNEALKKKGAVKLDLGNSPIDAVSLPAAKAANAVVIFALTGPYQRLKPHNYDCYNQSADVVLWNPTGWTPKQYEKDLQKVVEKTRLLHPYKEIAIIARCATVDPTIAAGSALNDRSISLILDRGHGNVYNLVNSSTIFAKLPCIQRILKRDFDCEGEKKIANLPGKILFIDLDPTADQVMWRGGGHSLSEDLYQARKHSVHKQSDQHIRLSKSDHWLPWNRATYDKVHEFLGLQGVDTSKFKKQQPEPSWCKLNVVRWLNKSLLAIACC